LRIGGPFSGWSEGLSKRPNADLCCEGVPLLGVDADHGIPLPAKTPTQFVDLGELRVAEGVSGADLFAIHAEREMELAEQTGHRAGAHPNAQSEQLCRNLGCGATGPSQTADGVASGVGFQ